MKNFSIILLFFFSAALISSSVAKRPFPEIQPPLGLLCRYNVLDALFRGVDISPRCCSAVDSLVHVSRILSHDHWLRVAHRRCLDQAAAPQPPPNPTVPPPASSPLPSPSPTPPPHQAPSSPAPSESQ